MSRLRVLSAVLAGALSDEAAARALKVSVGEIRRMRHAIAPGPVEMTPVAFDAEARQVELLDTRGASFDAPFFDDTIREIRARSPGRLNFDLDRAQVISAGDCRGRCPSGFIFHVGRCGSTLLANMLACSPAHRIVKEPAVVNTMLAERLREPTDASPAELDALIASVIRLLASAAAGAFGHGVVKFAAWNVQLAETLLELFPATNAVFVYRSPMETVASMLHQRPGWFDRLARSAEAQAIFLPTTRREAGDVASSPVALLACAWSSAVEAALALPRERAQLLSYEELTAEPARTARRALEQFGDEVSPASLDAMVATTAIYSKDPTHTARYDPDGAHQRPRLSRVQADQVARVAGGLWEELRARAGAPQGTGGRSRVGARR